MSDSSRIVDPANTLLRRMALVKYINATRNEAKELKNFRVRNTINNPVTQNKDREKKKTTLSDGPPIRKASERMKGYNGGL